MYEGLQKKSMEEESIKVSKRMTTGQPSKHEQRVPLWVKVLCREVQVLPLGCTPGGKEPCGARC